MFLFGSDFLLFMVLFEFSFFSEEVSASCLLLSDVPGVGFGFTGLGKLAAPEFQGIQADQAAPVPHLSDGQARAYT